MSGWVLIVDDEPDSRELLAELLESDGYAVASCGTAAGAESLLDERGRPCVVLADVLLPDMNGTTFVARMKARPGFETTPVIFLTGIDARTIEHLKEPVLMKPFDLEELMTLVSQRCGPQRPAGDS